MIDEDFEDLDGRPGFDLSRVDVSLLASPVVVRALAGIVVAALVLAWPDRTDQILARLIGVAVISVSATALWAAVRVRPVRLDGAVPAVLGLAAAGWLFLSPNQSDVVLARLIGVGAIALALRDLVEPVWRRTSESAAWIGARSAALVGVGTLLLSFPAEVFAALTTIAALGWIILSVVVIVATLDARTAGVTDYAESMQLVADWLDERPKSADDRQALYDKILFEGAATGRRIARFVALMSFASVIASMGVITDSTAVVIGAMLIAPLMTPLMGMAISLVMGWPRRLGRSALVSLGGIALAITIGALLGLMISTVIDPATNAQIVGRSSPTVLDLVIAMAAGAAGAYGLSRPDVSDSLPGVAIAISLVPPLTVVGISYSQGNWASGNGALLLFATNMLAILIMGGVTFVLTGVTPLRRATENQHRVRTAISAIGGLSALVVGGLLLNGAQIGSNLLEQSTAEATVTEWLDDHPDHLLVGVDVDGDTVVVTIVGPSSGAPTVESLAGALAEALERTVTADLSLTVQERDIAVGGD